MRKITTRLAEKKDSECCAEWAVSGGNPVSTVLDYPSAITVAVEEESKPALFQTAYPALVLEALVVNPQASKRQTARAIKELYASMKRLCKEYGLPEMMFWTKSKPMEDMVSKHRMFEKVELNVYRCKVGE